MSLPEIMSESYEYVSNNIIDFIDTLTSQTPLENLDIAQEFVWGYVGIFVVLTLGLYLTIKSKGMQFRAFPGIIRYVRSTLKTTYTKDEVHPLKVFFASLGGCVGIGNIFTICLAIKLGGPGAVFWMWVVAMLGVMLKYGEIYLGMRFREQNKDGQFFGGPMYFLRRAFPKAQWVSILMALFMCVYGVEILMFNVVQSSVSENFGIDKIYVGATLLALVLLGVLGGIRVIGNINSIIIPAFIVGFLGLTLWVLFSKGELLGEALNQIFSCAFSSQSAFGVLGGISLSTTIARGVSGACYSGDVGIGYDSIMYAEATVEDIKKQANLSVLNIFLDTFVVCTCTALIVVATGVWSQDIEPEFMIQTVFADYFSWAYIMMPILLFTLAYTTMIAYFHAGLKCAAFISPQYGKPIYYVFGISAFIAFSFLSTKEAAIIMQSAGAGLLIVNSLGIFKLRKEIEL